MLLILKWDIILYLVYCDTQLTIPLTSLSAQLTLETASVFSHDDGREPSWTARAERSGRCHLQKLFASTAFFSAVERNSLSDHRLVMFLLKCSCTLSNVFPTQEEHASCRELTHGHISEPYFETTKAHWGTGTLFCAARYVTETNKGDKHFPQVSDPCPDLSLVEVFPVVSRTPVLPQPIFVSYCREQQSSEVRNVTAPCL